MQYMYCRTGNFRDMKSLGHRQFACMNNSRLAEVLSFKNTIALQLTQVIFTSRKFSQISRFSRNSRKFPAHENMLFYINSNDMDEYSVPGPNGNENCSRKSKFCWPISSIAKVRKNWCPIEFYLPVTIATIPDVLVTNLITKLY